MKFDLLQYMEQTVNVDDYLRAVYPCTGLSSMEGLVEDIRKTIFPCVMVEIGDEGWLDMLAADNSQRDLVFYILEKKDNATVNDIREMLVRTKAKGYKILREMRAKGREYGDLCYGIDFSRINFMKVGPLAFSAYGYCFTLTINEQ